MKLDQYKSKQHFSVPEGYFDQFQSEVMQAVRHEMENDKRKRRQRNYWIGFTGIAASFAIIIGFLSYSPSSNKDTQLALNDIAPTITTTENQEVTTHAIEEATLPVSSVVDEYQLATSSSEKESSPAKIMEISQEVEEKPQPLKETILYAVMEYYSDDHLYELFSETLYDLECCYDY